MWGSLFNIQLAHCQYALFDWTWLRQSTNYTMWLSEYSDPCRQLHYVWWCQRTTHEAIRWLSSHHRWLWLEWLKAMSGQFQGQAGTFIPCELQPWHVEGDKTTSNWKLQLNPVRDDLLPSRAYVGCRWLGFHCHCGQARLLVRSHVLQLGFDCDIDQEFHEFPSFISSTPLWSQRWQTCGHLWNAWEVLSNEVRGWSPHVKWSAVTQAMAADSCPSMFFFFDLLREITEPCTWQRSLVLELTTWRTWNLLVESHRYHVGMNHNEGYPHESHMNPKWRKWWTIMATNGNQW